MGDLRFLGFAIGALLLAAGGCANKGTASGTIPDAATKIMPGAGGNDGAAAADGSVAPTPDGTCPAATILCNGYCLAAGQSSNGCIALVAGLDAEALAVAGGYVYYPVAGAVWRLPTGGGEAAKFVDAAQNTTAMAVDATNLYLTGSASDGSTIVGYAPLAGGSFKKLQGKDNGSTQIGGIAVDSSYIYWTETPGLDGAQPAIFRIAIAGGNTVDIGHGTAPNAIAVDTQYVYWSDNAAIWRTALATAGTMPLGDAGANAGGAAEFYSTFIGYSPVSMVAASGELYWGDDSELMVLATTGDGGAAQTLASDSAESLVLDGTDIYLTTASGQVVRYQTTSATSQTLATIPPNLPNLVYSTLVVDAANVYVLIAPAGEGLHGIVKISK